MSLLSNTKFEPSKTIIAFEFKLLCTFEFRIVKFVAPA